MLEYFLGRYTTNLGTSNKSSEETLAGIEEFASCIYISNIVKGQRLFKLTMIRWSMLYCWIACVNLLVGICQLVAFF